MRAAIYARTALADQTGIEKQIVICREFAQQRSWEVNEDYLFCDLGASGTTIEGRYGLQALLKAAGAKQPAFDLVLIEDTSRLGRRLSDVLRITDTFRESRVFVLAVTQGIDSRDVNFRQLLCFASMQPVSPVPPETVRRIYELFNAGLSLEQITTAMNNDHESGG